jgi:hypothetical protein
LSYLGDRGALKVADDAQRSADAGFSTEPVWPWVFQFDTAKVASYRAITASRLGLATIARDAFEVAADSARSPKQAAVVAVEQARAIAVDGHPDQACELAQAAFRDRPATTPSASARLSVISARSWDPGCRRGTPLTSMTACTAPTRAGTADAHRDHRASPATDRHRAAR